MKSIIWGLITGIMILGSTATGWSATSLKSKTYKLMVFGDSLSAGYRLNKQESFANQLQNALTKAGFQQVRIINVSQSGRTTAGGLQAQPAALKQKPDGVILELGINDILRGYGVLSIEQNLSQLIQNFQDADVPVLLAGMKAPPITEPVYAKQFDNMYVSLSRKYNVMLYPFFMQGIFEAAGNQYEQATPYLLRDKAHPTAEGVSLMVEHIFPTIVSFLKKQNIIPN